VYRESLGQRPGPLSFNRVCDRQYILSTPTARILSIKGLETSGASSGRQWTSPLQGAGVRWNQSEQTNQPQLNQQRSRRSEVRAGHYTDACVTLSGVCAPVVNPLSARKGDPTANSPPLAISAWRARYEWNIGNFLPFVQFGASHSGHFIHSGGCPTRHSHPVERSVPSRGRFENPAYYGLRRVIPASPKDAWYLKRVPPRT